MDRFLYNTDLRHGQAKCKFRLMECLSVILKVKTLGWDHSDLLIVYF